VTPIALPLACTVRDCGLPLERRTTSFVCPRGHSYDIARTGYVNLLQPQDRRSKTPGDSKAVIAARARLLQSGVGTGALERIVARAAALDLGDSPVVVDLGAGTGDALGGLAARRRIAGIGIDLAVAATDHAAPRFPELTWVVANADRRLPLLDQSVDLIMSLHGRRNPAESARILKLSGFLLVAVPAPDDLIELRRFIQGDAIARQRINGLIAEHELSFAVVARFEARERAHLERPALLDLLRATYRGARTSASDRIDRLSGLDVTIASDCVLMKLLDRSLN
jgi:23S rRNA (guanine745-N1)-methyltransferase